MHAFTVWQVLDEIGIDLTAQLTAAPKKRVAAPTAAVEVPDIDEEEQRINARLAALKS